MDLVLSFALRKTSEEDFLRQFPASPEDKRALGLRILREALVERHADAVEAGIILGYRFGLRPDYVDVLERLAGEDWHRKHEDVVFGLGKLAAPTSVDAILGAARSHHPYLHDVDESFALRSKAIHALRNIGTAHAVRGLGALLEELESSDEPEDPDEELEDSDLRHKIVRRFQELASDGTTDEVRALAKEMLSRAETARPSGKA